MSRQVKLSEPVVKRLKEVALLEGKSEEDVIAESLQAYVHFKYGIDDLERYSMADALRILRAMQHIARLESEILGFRAAMQPVQPMPPPQPEEAVEEKPEYAKLRDEILSRLDELEEKISMTHSKIAELSKTSKKPESASFATMPSMNMAFDKFSKMFNDLMELITIQYIEKMRRPIVEKLVELKSGESGV